jgi:hypothetical protein
MTTVSGELAAMRQRGVNPSSPSYSGVRARTREATANRERSFERLLGMIANGRNPALRQPGIAPNAFAAPRTVGPRGLATDDDYNARVQQHLAQLRGGVAPQAGALVPQAGAPGAAAPGIRRMGVGIAAAPPGVRGIGEGELGVGVLGLSPRQLRDKFPEAGARRGTGPFDLVWR